MRSPLPALAAVVVALAATFVSTQARADASAWVFVGGGAMGFNQENADFGVNGTMKFDVGVGTSPDASFIFGGLARIQPYFGEGTDFALLTRTATKGFQAGDFGLALDLGVYGRGWGPGSAGFAGSLSLGLPLALTTSLEVSAGSNDAFGVGLIAGIDLARLTIYRKSLLDWWPNPIPAQRTGAR